MTAAPAASIVDVVLGATLGSTAQDGGNRVAFEGLSIRPANDGTLEIALRSLTAASLRLEAGPLTLELGQLALHELAARVRVEAGRPRLLSLQAASAELSDVKVQGGVPAAAGKAAADAAGPWNLGPLAAADGMLHAEIRDAHLLFDADVTVPIRQGNVDFNAATVEHVGPDSRMGISRLGLYVDAPNGRSYLYQFASAPVAGVEYERRGALLGARVSDRGHLRLQPFGEALLRQGLSGHGPGVTEQARLLLARTAVSGHVQLGDGTFAAPGVQAEVVGGAAGGNIVRLHSEAVGSGLTMDLASLSVRSAVVRAGNTQLACDEAAGALVLRLFVEGGQLRFALTLAKMKISGLRLGPQRDQDA